MQDGSRQRYDPITLPSEVYLNKSKLFTKGIVGDRYPEFIIGYQRP